MNGCDRYQEMLVLAGLAYRGFSEAAFARQGVEDGLESLTPVRGKWNLVWGPCCRGSDRVFDSSAVYIVQRKSRPCEYVIAVRGTNPVSLHDWLYGDLNVGNTVAWPFAGDAAISNSTANGLHALIQSRWSPTAEDSVPGRLRSAVSRTVGDSLRDVSKLRLVRLRQLLAPLEECLTKVIADTATDADVPQILARILNHSSHIPSADLLPPAAQQDRQPGETLLEFLSKAAKTASTPLDITVTGHSKGGALAPALALWLTETGVFDNTVGSVAFAGPTPGNAAFAARIDEKLGAFQCRIANRNDVITNAWDPEGLRRIPDLYGKRSRPLRKIADRIARDLVDLGYRQPSGGVIGFDGVLDDNRSLLEESVTQHLDAYIEYFGMNQEMDSLTFFLG